MSRFAVATCARMNSARPASSCPSCCACSAKSCAVFRSQHDGHEDAGRALFILAQVATAKRDMAGATGYFQQALKVAQEPKVIAWSHIYLGRIFDLQERRENALDEYHAALTAGGTMPEVKAAAERGLQQPYEPQASAQQQDKK